VLQRYTSDRRAASSVSSNTRPTPRAYSAAFLIDFVFIDLQKSGEAKLLEPIQAETNP